MGSNVSVVTSLYGEKHLPFVLVLIESLTRLGIDDIILVCHNVSSSTMSDSLNRSNVRIVVENFPKLFKNFGDGTRSVEASKKGCLWQVGLESVVDLNRPIVFLDADTMVLKPLDRVFQDRFDIGYTIRDGYKWPLNTGVLFVVKSPSVDKMFEKWVDYTEKILSDNVLIQEAIDKEGGADQMSFRYILNEFKDLTFLPLSSKTWNMDKCTRDMDSVGIFHFKGCLPLLLKQRLYGVEYGDERTPAECEGAFAIWREMYKSVGRAL